MLVLARKIGQSIIIGEDTEITIIEVRSEQVRLGITAPKTVPVHRKELLEQMQKESPVTDDEAEEKRQRLATFVQVATDIAKRTKNAV